MMFIHQTVKRNPKLIETSFKLHEEAKVLPDTYIIDVDTFLANSKKILDEANGLGIDLYFMLKQVARNPYLGKELVKMGYKGAVVVDFKEALIMKKYNIPIANIGHLVQTPKALLKEFVDYGVDYMTVFSLDKIKDINEAAKALNKKQKLLLKVVGDNDMIYSGQIAGFRLNELDSLIDEVKKLDNVIIDGVTSFPCFLYDEEAETINPTNNFNTLFEAKKILNDKGISISNINAPSTTSVMTLKKMEGYGIKSAEPGHGLSGTTPLHAYKDLDEIPCVTYVSEVSHNFDHKAYVYGGGRYRRSHVKEALVGNSIKYDYYDVIAPSDESIDYYFGLNKEAKVNDTVIMAFRFQMFVTRANVCLVKGIQDGNVEVIGTYTSLGELYG